MFRSNVPTAPLYPSTTTSTVCPSAMASVTSEVSPTVSSLQASSMLAHESYSAIAVS